MRIVLAQLNYTVGDLVGNSSQILDAIHRHAEADLIVFTELAVSGYYPYDLLDRASFREAEAQAVQAICNATRNCRTAVLLGHLQHAEGPKPLRNGLSVFQQGEVLFQYQKSLLPTYNIFAEDRHFGRGELSQKHCFELNGQRIGVMICEDAWYRDPNGQDPVAYLAAEHPDLVLHINASPSNLGKIAERERIVLAAAEAVKAPWIYVNQVGSNDELVYDGGSFVYLPLKRQKLAQLPWFVSESRCIDFDQPSSDALPARPEAQAFIHQQIRLGLRDYLRKCGFERIVVGSSGGIDSALTLALAADALGADKVTAITMPGPYSSSGSVLDSQALCANLGIKLLQAPITEIYERMNGVLSTAFEEALKNLPRENLQARLRGVTLMAYSNQTGALLLSTGNKSEMAVGYATLYGDMNGGLNLIGDLYKTEVYALAEYLNAHVFRGEAIPQSIIAKPPSAELAPNQKDTDSLPPYTVLDSILKLYLEQDLMTAAETQSHRAILQKAPKQEVHRVLRMVDRAEFKRRQAPPIIRIHARSFGDGRRLLVANRFVDESL